MNESLSPEKITQYLRTTFLGRKILCFDVLDSTNCEAARRALAEEEGTVIISEQQTTGRGRFGRKWQSPGGKGIWMSIILKPQLPPDVIPQLTLAGARQYVWQWTKQLFLSLEEESPSNGQMIYS